MNSLIGSKATAGALAMMLFRASLPGATEKRGTRPPMDVRNRLNKAWRMKRHRMEKESRRRNRGR